jgi:hypothetical protein
MRYRNTDGRLVRTRFTGLGELLGPIDPIAHGAELSWQEFVGASSRRLKAMVVDKASLAAFAPCGRPSPGVPNYVPESVMKELERRGFSRASLGLPSRRKHGRRGRTRSA